MMVEELVSSGGHLMGASGTIQELGHTLDKQWCAFFLRMGRDVDFTAHPGDYMVWISLSKLPVNPSPEKALYEWVTIDDSAPCLCGYGMVAETSEQMGQTYEATMATRKRLLG